MEKSENFAGCEISHPANFRKLQKFAASTVPAVLHFFFSIKFVLFRFVLYKNVFVFVLKIKPAFCLSDKKKMLKKKIKFHMVAKFHRLRIFVTCCTLIFFRS